MVEQPPGRSRRIYGGQSAEERDTARRERVRAALLDVVGHQGYDAVTVDRICARAGVSTRHFYDLFGSKDDAFADLYRSVLFAAVERVVTSLSETEGQPALQRAQAAAMGFLEPIFDDPRVARAVFVEPLGRPGPIREALLGSWERLAEVIVPEAERLAALGEIERRDFRFVTMALVGATIGVTQDWQRHPGRYQRDQVCAKVSGLVAGMFVG